MARDEQVELEIAQLHGDYYAARMPPAAIQTSKLSKDYGLGHGLFDLDLEVAPQEVFGYLGPNGAGKSTTIRCLMGMIRPTLGSAHIFGLDCQHDSVAVKRKVGYMPGEMPQFGSMRGRDVVAYLGGLRGGADSATVRNIAQRFDLDLGRRYREYSSGNKKKLGIVLAFMHKPDLLILDEPTGGLDPLNQQEFYNLLRETRDAGATVFLSSHILSEVEHVCDRVGIIRAGRLVKVAELDEIHHIRLHRLELEFAPGTEMPVEAIRSAAGVEDVVARDRTVTCTVKGTFDPLLKALNGSTVTNLVSHEPSLEEIFLTYYRPDATSEAITR
jgi:ABC-2 type transport system ATP-binding protein